MSFVGQQIYECFALQVWEDVWCMLLFQIHIISDSNSQYSSLTCGAYVYLIKNKTNRSLCDFVIALSQEQPSKSQRCQS